MCCTMTPRFGFVLAFAFLFGAVVESEAAVLLGHWKMEENQIGQKAVDSSVNGRIGTYGAALNPNVYGPSGFGLATDFAGATATMALSDLDNALHDLSNGFSVLAWINPDVVNVNQRVMANSTWGFGIDGGVSGGQGRLRFTTYGVKDYRGNVGVLPANTWSHVAAVFDTNYDATFYVNGIAVGTDTHTSMGTAKTGSSYIGGNSSSETFNGRIDEVAAFSGTLTQAQIASYMNSGIPTPKQTVFRYDYDSSEPLPTIPDDSGASHPATASGGTAYSTNTPWPNGFSTSLLPGGLPKGMGDRSVNTSAGGIATSAVNLVNNAAIADAGGFTMETWVYRLADSGSTGLEKIIDIAGLYRLQLRPSSDATGDSDTVEFNRGTGTAVLPLGQWHHVAAVVDSLGNDLDGSGNLNAVARFFFDGRQMGVDTPFTLSGSESADYLQTRGIGLGRHPVGSELFQGLLYDSRVVLGALSPGEFLLVPEPSSFILALLALLGLAGRPRRNPASK